MSLLVSRDVLPMVMCTPISVNLAGLRCKVFPAGESLVRLGCVGLSAGEPIPLTANWLARPALSDVLGRPQSD